MNTATVGAEAKMDRKFEISVIYNGISKRIKVEGDDTVKQVLEQAIRVFSPLPQPHLLSLFTETGRELNDSETVKEAGIGPHEQLLLRPSQVKGGLGK